MRKIFLLITLIGLASFSFGQFTPSGTANDMFSDGDKSTIEKAEKSFSSANRLIKKAEKIEKKYQKYNNSKKRKKYESKTKEAKMLRVQAQEEKAKGYKKIVNVYLNVLSAGKFHFEQDRELANQYIESAEAETKNASSYLKKYKGLKKSKYKKIRYSAIENDIQQNEDAYQNSLTGLEDAMALLSEQEGKKANENSDKNAWDLAEKENTIAAYRAYLGSHPNGNYAIDAKQRIGNLQAEAEAAAAAASKAENAITYKVQILADRNAWTKVKVSKIYPNVSPDRIFEWFDDKDSFFKYATGEFSTYQAAKSLREQLKNDRQDVFIIAFKKGYQIDIVEARTATNELDIEE